MISRARGLVVASVAGIALPTLVGMGAITAHAATPAQPAAKAAPRVAETKHKGYVVRSVTATSNAGQASSATADCPSGLVVLGGGAFVASTDLHQNIYSSSPGDSGTGWLAYINNSGTTTSTFTVYAVCAKRPTNWTIVETSTADAVPNPAGTQRSVTVSCPSATVPLGGGGSNGGFPGNGLATNTSEPVAHGWRFDQNNASTDHSNAIYAYAVCAQKPKHYVVVAGPGSTYGASAQGSDEATCPSGDELLGGGAYSNSNSTTVDLNSTYPDGKTWRSYVDDTGTVGSTVTSYAVCAEL